MRYIEHLESRSLFNSINGDSLFKKDVVRLNPDTTYILSKPVHLRSHQKVIGPNVSQKHLPIIQYKHKGRSVLMTDKDIHNVSVSNVIISAHKSIPAIRVGGNDNTFTNISVTSGTGSAFIVENASKILIKDCNQTSVTQRGFIYGHQFWNLVVRNVTTNGNLFENEMRFHKFDGLALLNIRIDAANPEANRGGNAGVKDNALRIHDGKRAWVNGATISGNVYFGVMDGNNGGLDSLKRRDMATYRAKMRATSRVVAENIKIYGNLVLGTNLTFKINNLGMVSWNRGTCITVNPQYGTFKGGEGLYRKPATGIVNGLYAKFTKKPIMKKLNSLVKMFERKVHILKGGDLVSGWYRITYINTYFNKKLLK